VTAIDDSWQIPTSRAEISHYGTTYDYALVQPASAAGPPPLDCCRSHRNWHDSSAAFDPLQCLNPTGCLQEAFPGLTNTKER
jgi:hypothetical protein